MPTDAAAERAFVSYLRGSLGGAVSWLRSALRKVTALLCARAHRRPAERSHVG